MDPSVLYRRIRRRCDLLESEFIEDDEIGEIAEESYFDLWDFLLATLGEEAPFEAPVTLSTVANQAHIDVALAQGCYRLLRMDTALSGNRYIPIGRGNLASDAMEVAPRTWTDATGVRYYARRGTRAAAASRLGSADSFAAWRFYFDPIPVAVYSVRLWYVPPPPIVISGDDPATYTSFPDEWPEYVVADVAAKIAVRQEADPAPHETERERVRARIERYAKPHQLTQTMHVADQRQHQDSHAYGADHPFWARR